jgi:hypothetical protein
MKKQHNKVCIACSRAQVYLHFQSKGFRGFRESKKVCLVPYGELSFSSKTNQIQPPEDCPYVLEKLLERQ